MTCGHIFIILHNILNIQLQDRRKSHVMDMAMFVSGDNNTTESEDKNIDCLNLERNLDKEIKADTSETSEKLEWKQNEISLEFVEDKESHLKERIDQCKNIIAALKLELDEEKSKLDKEAKGKQDNQIQQNKLASTYYTLKKESIPKIAEDIMPSSNKFVMSMDHKLNCDEYLIEYEKQLQKYQNTLNMAQIEKKNAIRKEMLTKAYKLKLLEVENQCNVELLRIKQSLQCLEPLKVIVEKWKVPNCELDYDLNNLELIPCYPDLTTNIDSDVSSTFNGDIK